MSSVKYYVEKFAESGDVAPIPDALQPDGSVSYTAGFTNDYQLEYPTDPSAKPIPRTQFNQLIYDITANIQQYQQYSIPQFITALDNGGVNFPYSKFARVRYDAGTGLGIRVYMSISDSNTSLPTDSTKWILEKGASSIIIATSGSFIVPSYVNIIYVTAIGGGGGGGGSGGATNSSSLPRAAGGGAGGGAGAGVFYSPVNVTSGETLSISVGTGGTGGAAGTASTAGGSGSAGLPTSVARGITSLVTCHGGEGAGGSLNALTGRIVTQGGVSGSVSGQDGSYGIVSFDQVGGLNEAYGGIGGSGGVSIIGVSTKGGIQTRATAGSAGANAVFSSEGGWGNGGGGASGGSCAAASASQVGAAGGNGSNGVVIINY